MTSPDGIIWDSRSSGVIEQLEAVATSGDQFFAVGDIGRIIKSTDGINWETVESPVNNKRLADITCTGSEFIVVGDDGTILTSYDNATNWGEQTSGTGEDIHSVAWSGTKLVAVGSGGTVLYSDGVGNWEVVQLNTGYDLKSVEAVDSRWVAVGSEIESEAIFPLIITSEDAITWEVQVSGTFDVPLLNGVIYSGDTIVVVGEGGAILTSP